jgi:hypothetical protein
MVIGGHSLRFGGIMSGIKRGSRILPPGLCISGPMK